jgi:hypothetical protein
MIKTDVKGIRETIDIMERVEVTHTAKSFGKTGSKSLVSPRCAAKGIANGFYEPIDIPKKKK